MTGSLGAVSCTWNCCFILRIRSVSPNAIFIAVEYKCMAAGFSSNAKILDETDLSLESQSNHQLGMIRFSFK